MKGEKNMKRENARDGVCFLCGRDGTEDPLEQRSTIAWKVPAFCAKILQQTWMLRIEHGISA